MDMSLYLSALINVFNIVPSFLLPVFSNGVQFFFQVLDNDTISRFEEADLSQFAEKTVYQILDRRLYKPGSPAVYGIDLPGGKYNYGNSEKIADAYFSNLPDPNEYPDFTQSMRNFLKERDICEKPRADHEMSAVFVDGHRKPLKQDFVYLAKQREEKLSNLHQVFSELSRSAAFTSPLLGAGMESINADTVARVVAKYHQILSDNVQLMMSESLELPYSTIFRRQKSIYAEMVENAVCAICKPEMFFFKTRDIFAFRRIIKDPNKRYAVQYDKLASEIPVELQIKLLDVLFRYSPKNCLYPFIRRSHQALWDLKTAFHVYSSICTHTHWACLRMGLFKAYLVKLGLDIEIPKHKVSDEELDSADNCIIELLPSIEETANMEEAHLFWFEIKALSGSVYAILAQDYKTRKNRFCLKEDSISSEDLIDFIVALNHDILGEKVMLMRLRSEKFPHLFDDRLSDWLSENEDKCIIYDVYHGILRGDYE